MDLWLCHAPTLSSKEIELLQEKAAEIEKWAMTLGLEVHFSDRCGKVKAGAATPLSSESSGSTQHHLLLEEFYRTALYVAGRYPFGGWCRQSLKIIIRRLWINCLCNGLLIDMTLLTLEALKPCQRRSFGCFALAFI